MADPSHAPERGYTVAELMPPDYNPFHPRSIPAGAAGFPAHAAAATPVDQIPVDYFEIHHGPGLFLRATREDAHQIWQWVIKSAYIAEYYGYKYAGPKLQVVAPPDPDGAGTSPIEPAPEPPGA